MNEILLNDFKRQWEDVGTEVLAAVKEVGESGHLILGASLSRFEQELAKFCGVQYAIGCANGMDALELSLRALDISAGDWVLTTPLSAFASTLAILKVGATPCFVDICEDGLINFDLVEKALTEYPQIKAFLPVHLFGHALNLERLKTIQQKFQILIVEDCAQAIGARYNDTKVASVGNASGLSFYPTKNLGAYGDAGAVLTNDKNLALKIRSLRDYGQTKKYRHDFVGMNSRLDEMQAAILQKALLPRLPRFLEARLKIATLFLQKISHPKLKLASPQPGSAWHLFPILVEGNRDAFIDYLRKSGVQSGVHYPIPIHKQKALLDSVKLHSLSPLEVCESFCEREVSLPIHPYLLASEIDRVIKVCNDWSA